MYVTFFTDSGRLHVYTATRIAIFSKFCSLTIKLARSSS